MPTPTYISRSDAPDVRMEQFLRSVAQAFSTGNITWSASGHVYRLNPTSSAIEVQYQDAAHAWATLLTIAITRPTVTGSKGGNAALASLLSALAGMSLIIDSST